MNVTKKRKNSDDGLDNKIYAPTTPIAIYHKLVDTSTNITNFLEAIKKMLATDKEMRYKSMTSLIARRILEMELRMTALTADIATYTKCEVIAQELSQLYSGIDVQLKYDPNPAYRMSLINRNRATRKREMINMQTMASIQKAFESTLKAYYSGLIVYVGKSRSNNKLEITIQDGKVTRKRRLRADEIRPFNYKSLFLSIYSLGSVGVNEYMQNNPLFRFAAIATVKLETADKKNNTVVTFNPIKDTLIL